MGLTAPLTSALTLSMTKALTAGRRGPSGGGGEEPGGPGGLLTSLSAHYALDETGLTADRADSLGAKPLSVFGGNIASGSGIIGNATRFQFNTIYLGRASNDLITGTAAHSISMWLKIATVSNTRTIMDLGDAATGETFLFRQNNATDLLLANFGSSATWAPDIDNNVFRHVVLTIPENSAPSAVTLYVDGSLVAQSASSGTDIINTGADNCRFGSNVTESANMNGYMDELAIWTGRVLTLPEVQWLYNSGSGRQYSEYGDYA